MSRWGDYLQATKVQGAEKAIQLLECCDPGLRRDLQRNNGGVVLSGLPVDAIVAAIKVLAVRIKTQQWLETACTVCRRTEKRM